LNNTNFLLLNNDTSAASGLSSKVENYSELASDWGSKVDQTTGRLANGIADDKSSLLSNVTSGAFKTNTSLLNNYGCIA
jgi:hypothetical protein